MSQHTPQNSYNKEELLASGRGEIFGAGNAQLPLPNMLMMDRIIRITDDGVGFTPVFAAGHGLSGMRDRLTEIGGSLRVDSAPGKGCTVTAVVPS